MTAFVTDRFRAAMDKLAVLEGFYSNRKSDRGGETIFGISRRWFPKWEGWRIVDAARGRADFPESLRRNADLHEAKLALYLKEFWIPLHCERFNSYTLAGELFELGVNVGPRPASKLLQEAINGCGRPVVMDGRIGPATISAANALPVDRLLAALARVAEARYRWIVENDPTQAENLKGWLSRLEVSA